MLSTLEWVSSFDLVITVNGERSSSITSSLPDEAASQTTDSLSTREIDERTSTRETRETRAPPLDLPLDLIITSHVHVDQTRGFTVYVCENVAEKSILLCQFNHFLPKKLGGQSLQHDIQCKWFHFCEICFSFCNRSPDHIVKDLEYYQLCP